MRMNTHALLITLICSVAMPIWAQDTMTYQGNLSNAARQPVSASYPMAFKLYAEREDGEALWTERYETVDVLDGVFSVELGGVTPFPLNIGNQGTLFLGVAINGGSEMLPRVKVSSALRAR